MFKAFNQFLKTMMVILKIWMKKKLANFSLSIKQNLNEILIQFKLLLLNLFTKKKIADQ